MTPEEKTEDLLSTGALAIALSTLVDRYEVRQAPMGVCVTIRSGGFWRTYHAETLSGALRGAYLAVVGKDGL